MLIWQQCLVLKFELVYFVARLLPGDTNALWIILGTAGRLVLLISAEDFFPSVSSSDQYDRHTQNAPSRVYSCHFPTDRPIHHVAHIVTISYAAP